MISPSKEDTRSCFFWVWGARDLGQCQAQQEGKSRRLHQRDSFDVPGTKLTANLVHPHNKFYNAELSSFSDETRVSARSK